MHHHIISTYIRILLSAAVGEGCITAKYGKWVQSVLTCPFNVEAPWEDCSPLMPCIEASINSLGSGVVQQMPSSPIVSYLLTCQSPPLLLLPCALELKRERGMEWGGENDGEEHLQGYSLEHLYLYCSIPSQEEGGWCR